MAPEMLSETKEVKCSADWGHTVDGFEQLCKHRGYGSEDSERPSKTLSFVFGTN